MPDTYVSALPDGVVGGTSYVMCEDSAGTVTFRAQVSAIVALMTNAGQLTQGTIPDARLSANIARRNDPEMTDSRTPTAHKASHGVGQPDALSPSDIGAASATHAAAHATGGSDPITPAAIGASAANHTHAYADITGKPSSFAPSTHASSHQAGGADAVPSVPATTNLAADTNALSVAAVDIVRLTSAEARNVNGLDATGCGDGKLVLVVNENAAGGAAITIKHNAGAAAAGNRVRSQFGSDIVLQPDGGQVLVHLSSVAGCWRA